MEGDVPPIVDSGVHDTPGDYIPLALPSVGRQPGDIELILNADGLDDPAGGNGQMVEATGGKVWIHETYAPMAEDPDYQCDFHFVNDHVLAGQVQRLDAG